MRQFQVRKDNFTEGRLVDSGADNAASKIAANEILLKIDRFGFSANNVTYAAAGDMLGYWQFFPPYGDNAQGWGMTPVWGFADVIESNVSEIPVGDRLFGYFPPATHLKIVPINISAQRLVDGAEHRSKLPPGYNLYRRVNAEPGYDRAMDNVRMLLWPLYVTSFCIWDALQDKAWYGAKQLVIVSASSKTGIGLACALSADKSSPDVVALTSSRNLDFVNALGLYDSSFSYDDLTGIDSTMPTALIDMSGNREMLARLGKHLGNNMKFCINVGLTHWDERGKPDGVMAERSEFFFAPGHIQKRMKDWGPDGFTRKTTAFMQQAFVQSREWLKLKNVDGLSGLSEIYPDVCAGRIDADRGLVVEM
ncbi:MAG: DUF2855 family protein [Gammaproteobacteria bacterium]|nr:DUF2855 family protein [Gammaproteobacteria bacterium]MDH4315049.1 DUF2855 family protein [Gammaproteobacteria bacterium]MDH5214044.1 DUF2855 family protein [Gammaproteobacteria bacterium]MDH5499666.1 DUF2855 family protein [Gammaproteobacteria bacterium]